MKNMHETTVMLYLEYDADSGYGIRNYSEQLELTINVPYSTELIDGTEKQIYSFKDFVVTDADSSRCWIDQDGGDHDTHPSDYTDEEYAKLYREEILEQLNYQWKKGVL